MKTNIIITFIIAFFAFVGGIVFENVHEENLRKEARAKAHLQELEEYYDRHENPEKYAAKELKAEITAFGAN